VIDDSTDGSGDNLVALSAPQNDSKVVTFPKPVTFSSGVYATLSGTGAKAYIYVA